MPDVVKIHERMLDDQHRRYHDEQQRRLRARLRRAQPVTGAQIAYAVFIWSVIGGLLGWLVAVRWY